MGDKMLWKSSDIESLDYGMARGCTAYCTTDNACTLTT